MRHRLHALLLAGVLSAPHLARADAVYTFVTDSFSFVDHDHFHGGYGPATGIPWHAAIVLPWETVRSGTFTLQGENFQIYPYMDPSYLESSGPFTSVSLFDYIFAMPPNILYGYIDIRMTFDSMGEITASSFNATGSNDQVVASGDMDAISGFIGSDRPGCNSSAPSENCPFTGHFVLPEPASLGMFGLGALLLGWVAARRKT